MDFLSWLNPVELFKAVVNWWNRPKIGIDFRQIEPGIQSNGYCNLRLNSSFESKKSWFFRLRIRNGGKTNVVGADVRVEKVEKEVKGRFEQLEYSPFFLHWANEQTDDSRNLYHDSPVFVDVVYTVEGIEDLFVFHKFKHSEAGIPSRLPPGKYRFALKVVAPDIFPVSRTVVITFSGDWSDLRLELLGG